jgi:hypothetical protein
MDFVSNQTVDYRKAVVSIALCFIMLLPALARSDVAKDTEYRPVAAAAKSELEQFASWFHQDWKLIFPDFYSGLKLYLDNLTPGRRQVLGDELQQFLRENSGASAEDLKRSWLRLGAQAWQASLDIRQTLEDFQRVIQATSDKRRRDQP